MPWGIKSKRERAEHTYFSAMQNSVAAGGEIRGADHLEFVRLVRQCELNDREQAMLTELLGLLSPSERAEIERLLV
jgi:hypothetical protein